ncbi:MAG: hypothetical protein WCP09_02760 [Candidatus Taylorbacteria bacterium]
MNISSFFPSFSGASILLYLFFAFIFFMIIRELVTWYWKINRITDLLEQIEKNTKPKDNTTDVAK